MTLRKRGRPIGSKNKPKVLKVKKTSEGLIAKVKRTPNVIDDFAQTLSAWDRMDAQTEWELVARKQEDRIQAYIAENEELAKICIMRWEEIQHLKYLVSYLEGKHEDSTV
jgi:hypothetical protein